MEDMNSAIILDNGERLTRGEILEAANNPYKTFEASENIYWFLKNRVMIEGELINGKLTILNYTKIPVEDFGEFEERLNENFFKA